MRYGRGGLRNDAGGEDTGVLEKYLSYCNFAHHKSHKRVLLTEMHFIGGT